MAQTKIFPFKESLKTGWNITKDNFIFFLLATIVLFLISSLGSLIPTNAVKAQPSLGAIRFVLDVISIFLSILINLGLIKVMLMFLDGQKPKFKELFSLSNKVITMFASSLLYGLIVMGGFILLIVPGLIWGLKFSLYKYFIVEKNAGPVEALKLSAQATGGAKWNLFLFGFVCAGVNILGLLCFGIGLLFTIPLTWIAMTFVYRKLAAQIGTAAPEAPAAPKA
jgi:uncharacterized membrane protein